jgi:site-specific DNA recombinase
LRIRTGQASGCWDSAHRSRSTRWPIGQHAGAHPQGSAIQREHAGDPLPAEPRARIMSRNGHRRLNAGLRHTRAVRAEAPPNHLWHYPRAPTLLSGKVVCGTCGGSFITSGRDHMARKAMTCQRTCGNKVRLRQGKLEVQVFDALASDPMRPDLVAEFVASFTAEWNRLAKASTSGVADKQRELEGVERKLSGLIDAIADGLRAQGL